MPRSVILNLQKMSIFSDPRLDYNLKMIAFDAQTSGGLLMSVPSGEADLIIKELHMAGLPSCRNNRNRYLEKSEISESGSMKR